MCEGLLEEFDGEDEYEVGCVVQLEVGDGIIEILFIGVVGFEKRMEKKMEQQWWWEKVVCKLWVQQVVLRVVWFQY